MDINICKNSPVNYYIPVNISKEELFIHNKSDNYYNDICKSASSKNGTDISLYDRKNEFNNNNLSLCAMGWI